MSGPVALDAPYLSRQTFGDIALERDLLTLFREQCRLLRPLMAESQPARTRSDAAHTLRGAAQAVGARETARLLDRIEAAIAADGEAAGLLRPLDAAIAAAELAIARRLAALSHETDCPGGLAKAAWLA